MEQTKKSSPIKKGIFLVLGIVLVIGTIGNLKYITDWSTAEIAGNNTWTIMAIVGGAFLIYFGLKK